MADYEHAEHAAKALDAYEQSRYRDDGTSHRTNLQIADATVEDLLRGLLHYADVTGIPFDEALGAARRSYAEDCVTDSPGPYELGDRVQLRPGCALPGTRAALPQRGTVVMVGDDGSCVVEFPGLRTAQLVNAGDLEPAVPFGPVRLRRGTIADVTDAEEQLILLGGRLLAAAQDGQPQDGEDAADQVELAHALAQWAGTHPRWVLACLDQNIKDAALITSSVRNLSSTGDPFALASRDFPASLDEVLAMTGPITASTNVVDIRQAKARRI